jgi:serpin B
MWKATRIAPVILSGLLFLHCSHQSVDSDNPGPPKRTTAELTAEEKSLCESANKFGLRLFREVVKQEEKESNIFISPLSVSMALGMTYNGANGATRDSMHAALEFADLSFQEINESYQGLIDVLTHADPKVQFQIANSIWHRLGLPEAADTINDWVDENTNGKIQEIVQRPVDPNVIMFLINAIYFKGAWADKFNPDSTVADSFTLLDGSLIECQMMRKENSFGYSRNSLFEAVNLPYGDSSFNMAVFLPALSVHVDSLAAQFTEENWLAWTDSFYEKKMVLHLPKFTIEYEATLNKVLKTMGMKIAFTPGADFSNMVENGGVWIDKVKQKAFVKVNEECTEAAAVTVVVVVDSLPLSIRFDRPFIFVIWEKQTKTILFLGKVMEPKYE